MSSEPIQCDLVVLGAGPGGYSAAFRAADLGLSVVLVERYAAASGRDVSAIGYYQAFGIWKLACILQGVYVRYAGGAAAGDRSGVDQFAEGVTKLGERALADVEAL